MKSKYKTNLICIQSGSSVSAAKEIMQERRIRHLPVINEANDIIGIVSRQDLTDISKFQELPVDIFASSPVVHVHSATPLREVTLKMLEKKISCVLVTDEHNEVTGIITTDDLLFHLAELLRDSKNEVVGKSVSSDSIFSMNSLMTLGEFSRKLSDIGI